MINLDLTRQQKDEWYFRSFRKKFFCLTLRNFGFSYRGDRCAQFHVWIEGCYEQVIFYPEEHPTKRRIILKVHQINYNCNQ